ncbi:alpha/beta hydrolase [Cohnella massiliensis]|uniref:alpha/beta hydrolase n=1 Tax=Cohnella massiliensis TaxID=1816691 RepID=UPI00111B41F4|nr:alpha/beta hydrolase [Cohnella massiliensis]
MEPTLRHETIHPSPMAARLGRRLRPGRRRMLAQDTAPWRAAAAGMWTVGGAMAAVGALGAPTGFGAAFDIAGAVALHTIGLLLAGSLVAWLLAVLHLALPGFACGAALFALSEVALILFFGDLGLWFSLGFAFFSVGTLALAGAAARMTFSRRFGWRRKLGAWLAVAGALLAVGATTAASGGTAAEPAALPSPEAAGEAIAPLRADDPSRPGSYAFEAFTYGSGQDRHRPEYGEEAAVVSASVDGSAYIRNWAWLRERFWGFDETSLPLNGRVWMPEGEGPFPLVLIVHGNHLMEDFSDGGYAYLGEQLASRGIAAVSVDENFLNFSVWSGIPDEDMKPRAWLLLQHIRQLQAFAADGSTPFYDRIDFDRIALIGHSRGGQAAAMAAAADQWFGEDAGLPDPDSYSIAGVAALAPTDTAVDGRVTRLTDVSYLVLQGAADADITSYYGERQYGRAGFSPSSEGFKASLYVDGANHGQFNTTWGSKDEAMPAALFLRSPSLSGEDQRQIAKAYLTAFAETVLKGESGYEALFRDYRAGALFLPDTGYWSRYESAEFVPVARFEEASDIEAPADRIDAEAAGTSYWTHEETTDRDGRKTGNRAVALKWEEEARYTLLAEEAMDGPFAGEKEGGSVSLVFSMSDGAADRGGESETEPGSGPESPDRPDAEGGAAEPQPGEAGISLSEAEVELADASGASARVAISDVMPILPSPATTFTYFSLLEETMDNGKYDESVQAVFQTYELPLELFAEANPAFDPDEIVRITFLFPEGPGEAMLDDIGFS